MSLVPFSGVQISQFLNWALNVLLISIFLRRKMHLYSLHNIQFWHLKLFLRMHNTKKWFF